MASMTDLNIFLEFEPIVKLVCHAVTCKNNLVQASNDPDRANRVLPACNLKQITVGRDGSCRNYEKGKD